MVGPGRGSAAGSIVAYTLRITDIDPIKYGLIFERFLNPERVSMPDIDIDFCYERRGEVIDYVTRKYGEDKVSQIQGQGRAFRSHCRTPLRPHHEPFLPGAGRICRIAGRTATGKYGEGIGKLYAGNFAVLL